MTQPLDWHRLSPLSAVYFAIKTLPHLIHLWPALAAFAVAGRQGMMLLVTIGLPLLVLALAVDGLIKYLTFRYAVESDRVSLRWGLLHRRRLTLTFDRVQQAELVYPFYFRPFGLAALTVESAGSREREVALPGLVVARAEALRYQVMSYQADSSEPLAAEGNDDSATDFSLRLGPLEVARYGFMHNGLLFLAPLAAPLGQYLGPALEQWTYWVQRLPLASALMESGWVLLWVSLFVGALFIVAGVVALFSVSAVIATIYYWDYRLERRGDRYQARFGLGTRRTRSLRRQKMQQVQLVQGMVARLLGRWTLLISKAGQFAAGQSPQSQRLVVPVLDEDRLAAMRTELGLERVQWQRFHLWTLFDVVIVWGAFLSFATFLTFIWSGAPWWLVLLWSLAWFPVLLLISWRRWTQHRYAVTDRWLVLRRGFIGRRECWLPKGKLQKTTLIEGPVLRWLGLSYLMVWTTDGMELFGCLPAARARALRDHLLAEIDGFRQPWF